MKALPKQFLADDPQGRLSVDWISGADMLLRKEAVGDQLFDESFFMYGEEVEWCSTKETGNSKNHECSDTVLAFPLPSPVCRSLARLSLVSSS